MHLLPCCLTISCLRLAKMCCSSTMCAATVEQGQAVISRMSTHDRQCIAGIQDNSPGAVGCTDFWHPGWSRNLSDGALLPHENRRFPRNYWPRLSISAMPSSRMSGTAQSVCSDRELQRLPRYKVCLLLCTHPIRSCINASLLC